ALVIDDDIYNVYAMTGALEQQGMTVVLAEDGRAGLAALREHPDVAVVLIDVTMPGMDAEGIVHALRATHEAPLPVVAVTARAMPGDRAKCLSAGASDYLAKPVNVAHMVALLKTWLGRTP
ncbi:MAG TPA: response regulator, partial [Rhodocyclaceae bacterium]